jgi:hypothetical protein
MTMKALKIAPNAVCKICDGGPGNHGTCLCGMDNYEPKIDFDSPEDVLIEVVADVEDVPSWRDYSIESCTVINGKDGIMGAARYADEYGGFLDYTCKDLIDCPGGGWWVIEGVTGIYHEGDGYTTDDDMSFSCKGFRPATAEERKMA